jgi:hypothetical protein
MANSFFHDRESDSRDWEPEPLELPLVDTGRAPRRPGAPVTWEIDAPEQDRGAHVIEIDLC